MSRQSDVIKSSKNWFDNAELSSSKHDEILIWLHAQINSNGFLQKQINSGFEVGQIQKIEIERPIMRGSSIVGFADLSATFDVWPKGQGFDFRQSIVFLFEVKTKVNLGETIRQIKYYGGQNWFVCAPDFPNKNLLYENDIGFIPYEP